LVLASVQIARAIKRHEGKVTVYVPHYAMSADEIVMSADAVLGPVDPQVGQYPAASVVKAVDAKPVAEVDDTTLILADQSRKALNQVSDTVEERAKAMGLNVSDQMPTEILELMDLYPQPVRTRPSVTYLPSRRRGNTEIESG
jgi:ClpP class serine protease